MNEFFKNLENELIGLWNYLYRFLCNLLGEEVNEDWIVKGPLGSDD